MLLPHPSMSSFEPHWALYILQSDQPIQKIDGDFLTKKDVWPNIPWSEDFVDIRGMDSPEGEAPQRTRFKAAWDNSHLYIGALLESDFGF